MNFISVEYIIFLTFSVLVCANLNNKNKIYFLLFSSYVFYSFWDFRFLILILISTSVDYFVSNQMYIKKSLATRKALLFISIFVNLSILFIFKYFEFFIESFMRFGFVTDSTLFNSLNIILPVGISFYTFQTISYTVDVYNNKIKPEKNFIVFATFVCFFPQLVAGPIERAGYLIPQLKNSRKLDNKLIFNSLYLIFQGFVFKTVIADNLSKIVEALYFEPLHTSSTYLLIGSICFSLQIYCDFAGYSRIARGSAGLLGVKLSKNFNFPYLSTSIQDFWRRWHITLSFWFRDYLYIPIGGNKNKIIKNIFNLLVTMTIAGLWHGAAWNFVLWGFLFGCILSLRYFKTIFNFEYKDLFVILFSVFLIYQSFVKPITYNYFEKYSVIIEENSIYNYIKFPADGRCLNSVDDIKNISIPGIEIKSVYFPSSFKCHNAVMGVSSETIVNTNEVLFIIGNNEILPLFITRKTGTIFLIFVLFFQRKYKTKRLSILSTFLLVNFLWVPFRIGGVENILNFFKYLLINNPILGSPPTEHWSRLLNIENGNYLSTTSAKFLFPIFIFVIIELIDYKRLKNIDIFNKKFAILTINLYFLLIILFSSREYSPFIYFQF